MGAAKEAQFVHKLLLSGMGFDEQTSTKQFFDGGSRQEDTNNILAEVRYGAPGSLASSAKMMLTSALLFLTSPIRPKIARLQAHNRETCIRLHEEEAN